MSFQLSETTWCLIGFDDNHSYMIDVTSWAAFLDFKIFRFFSNLNCILTMVSNGEKTTFADLKLQNS